MDKLEVLKKSIRELLNQPDLKVTREHLLIEDFGLESIDFLDMACDLEKELNCDIDIKAILKTFSDKYGRSAKEITVGEFVDLL